MLTILGHPTEAIYHSYIQPNPIHFTPLHSQHANEHADHVSCKNTSNYYSPVCANIQRLSTDFLEQEGIPSSALPDGLRHCANPSLPDSAGRLFLPTTALENSSTRCGSDRGRLCTCTLIKRVATFSQKRLYRSAFKCVYQEDKF